MDRRKIKDLIADKAILEVQDGNHGEKHPTAADYVDDGIPFLMARDFQDGHVDLSGACKIPKLLGDSLRIGFARSGDVLLTHKGSIGLVAIVPEVADYVMLTPQVTYYRTNPAKLLNTYLKYAFQAPSFRDQLNSYSAQSTRPYIGITAQKELELDVPPLPVQRRIASILSVYDELIENSQRRIRILESMAHALYRDWFVHFRFPGHEKHPRVGSPHGEIPKGWDVKPFSRLANYVNGYAFKPEDWGEEGKPIIKIRELKAGVTEDTPRHSGNALPEKYNVRDGDVLFSWSADLDAYLWTGGGGLLNQHLFNVLPLEGFTRAFCFHALKESMPRFRALSLGATMHHIKRSALDQVSAAIPPEALRLYFDATVAPMHNQLITLSKHVQNLHRTRDLLLPRLLSGQVALNRDAA